MNHFFLASTLSAMFFLPIGNQSEAQFALAPHRISAAGTNTTNTYKTSLVLSTGWEPVKDWKKSTAAGNTVMLHDRNLPEISNEIVNEGAVLVFVKGYNFSGMEMREKPLALPFVFFSPDENETGAYQWQPRAEAGKVSLSLYLPGQEEANFSKFKDNVQVRYFVLRPEFLRQHKLSLAQLKSMSYTKFVELTGEAE